MNIKIKEYYDNHKITLQILYQKTFWIYYLYVWDRDYTALFEGKSFKIQWMTQTKFGLIFKWRKNEWSKTLLRGQINNNKD